MVKVGIVGGTGYTGAELLRILSRHPNTQLVTITAAVQLGFMPLVEAGVVDRQHLIADAKSGVGGAGRKPEVHILFSEAADNFKAYGVAGHRHLRKSCKVWRRLRGRKWLLSSFRT